MTVKEICKSLREGPYAWPGGYPKYFVNSYGEPLSHEGVKKYIWNVLRDARDGFANNGLLIVGEDINWEDPDLVCAVTEKPIEAAYV